MVIHVPESVLCPQFIFLRLGDWSWGPEAPQ